MKRLRHIAVIALVIIVQLYLVIQFTARPVNLAKIPFRHSERAAAHNAFSQDPSPENKEALQQELRLASNHIAKQQFIVTGIVFAALLSFEGFLMYSGRKHESKFKTVA